MASRPAWHAIVFCGRAGGTVQDYWLRVTPHRPLRYHLLPPIQPERPPPAPLLLLKMETDSSMKNIPEDSVPFHEESKIPGMPLPPPQDPAGRPCPRPH